jgi:hypothetical protein
MIENVRTKKALALAGSVLLVGIAIGVNLGMYLERKSHQRGPIAIDDREKIAIVETLVQRKHRTDFYKGDPYRKGYTTSYEPLVLQQGRVFQSEDDAFVVQWQAVDGTYTKARMIWVDNNGAWTLETVGFGATVPED